MSLNSLIGKRNVYCNLQFYIMFGTRDLRVQSVSCSVRQFVGLVVTCLAILISWSYSSNHGTQRLPNDDDGAPT